MQTTQDVPDGMPDVGAEGVAGCQARTDLAFVRAPWDTAGMTGRRRMLSVGLGTIEEGTPNQVARVAAVSYTQLAYDPRVRREAGILADAGYQVDVYVSAEPAHTCPLPAGVNLHEVSLPRYRGARADRTPAAKPRWW